MNKVATLYDDVWAYLKVASRAAPDVLQEAATRLDQEEVGAEFGLGVQVRNKATLLALRSACRAIAEVERPFDQVTAEELILSAGTLLYILHHCDDHDVEKSCELFSELRKPPHTALEQTLGDAGWVICRSAHFAKMQERWSNSAMLRKMSQSPARKI